MLRFDNRKTALAALALTVALAISLTPAPRTDAADHGDAPFIAHDQGADIGDAYFFLDPNDNTRAVMIMTFHGFLIPGEAINFGQFDPAARFRFEIENTGDAVPDRFIDLRFSQRTGTAAAQVATIISTPSGTTFTANATNPNLSDTPPAPVITTNSTSGITFFAGVVDDPFFFDIPAFSRFVGSVLAGSPNTTHFSRARDSFAGYNTLAIVLSVPVAQIRGAGNEIGLSTSIQRRAEQVYTRRGEVTGVGRFYNVDRTGVPAVNVALVPFARKNEYNASTTVEDAAGKFAPGIVATLTALGTDSTSIGILASVAVTRGDILRLNVTTANTGTGGGNNAAAAFPNGRRLRDDVIDTLLFFINNRQPLGDNVNANDVAFRDTFPFVAAPIHPLPPGTTDDRTRN